MRINFKNFGLLEALVLLSLVYVVGMLIWTASTRPAVEAKANLVKENHKKVVDFINGEINNCGNNDEGKLTVWGDPCNGEWSSSKVVNYINKNLNLTFRPNVVYFQSPSEIKSLTEIDKSKIRVGGMVKKNSISINSNEVNFIITDFKNEINVTYMGAVPNLFAEEKGVVAEGFLKDRNFFSATKILAKHDENYMPPEVKEALEEK